MTMQIPRELAAPQGIQTSVQDYVPDFTRMLYMLYQDMELQITRADSKAQIILSLATVMIAAVANLGFNQANAMGNYEEYLMTMGINLLVISALATAIAFAIIAAFPRLRRLRKAINGTPDVFFSGFIVGQDPEDYVNTFNGMTLNEVKQAAMLAIHAKASVLARKYVSIQRSMRFAAIGVAIWVIGQGIISVL